MKIKNIVCIDTETTGLNANEDHIIQLSLVKIELQTGIELNVFDRYIIPERKFEISRSAEEVHGITKDFLLENGVYLKDVAGEILEILNSSDAYLTYNGNTFDFKFLIKDFAEIGYEFPLNKPCIDSYAMECRMNPRDLMSVYKKYVGASDEEVLKMVESDFGPIASEHLKVHGYLSLKQAKEYSRIYEIRDWDDKVGFMILETEVNDTEPLFTTKDLTQRE